MNAGDDLANCVVGPRSDPEENDIMWFLASLVTLVLLSSPGIAQAEAPFCVVSAGGTECLYYDADSCRQAAHAIGGACAINAPAPGSSGESFVEGVQRYKMRELLIEQQKRQIEQQKRQPVLDCIKVLGPSGLADCERLFGGR